MVIFLLSLSHYRYDIFLTVVIPTIYFRNREPDFSIKMFATEIMLSRINDTPSIQVVKMYMQLESVTTKKNPSHVGKSSY